MTMYIGDDFDEAPCWVTQFGRKVNDPTPQVQERVDAIAAVLDTLLIGTTDEHLKQLVVLLECRMQTPLDRAAHTRARDHHQDWIDYMNRRDTT